MANTPYQRTITTHFVATSEVSTSLLAAELLASAITSAMLCAVTNEDDGDTVTVTYNGPLSTSAPDDVGVFDAVIAAHTAEPLLKLDALHGGEIEDHRQVNYKSGLSTRLFKNLTDVFRGEVREVKYYLDEEMTDLVLSVSVEYMRDGYGMATDRTTTREWLRVDETPHPNKKVTKKLYDSVHTAGEGDRRRRNLLGRLKVEVLKMMTVSRAANPAAPTAAEFDSAKQDGVAYFSKYAHQISLYLETEDLSFKTSPASPNMTDDTEVWLDNNVAVYGWTGPTIRDEILARFKSIVDP